ncbi:L-serine ammonia-lyase [Agromyces archimandritae]|uniref:L-serine dehydratase n=1 Tax=Agromyces archimandritae TaxID=2781962 RepID=A0A975INA6_9MICO|nr:L-serine ammonia-lyase [Agromyces archimandritae]QTX04054.1 L-serine ammonia-lyase [Agromyces archimandritae]
MTAFVSALDLFSIGIGPSSSHTVGPMRAARAFAAGMAALGLLDRVDRVEVTLYGSLGATGLGHGTPDAVVAGLRGLEPHDCDPDEVRGCWSAMDPDTPVRLLGTREIRMSPADIALEPRTRLPGHPNALTLRAWAGASPLPLVEETYYSVGGGFIRREGETAAEAEALRHPLPYDTAAELIALCDEYGVGLADIARYNEVPVHGESGIDTGLDAIWAAMHECVEHGLGTRGTLPGGLRVKRRAPEIRERLEACDDGRVDAGRDTSTEWLHAYALAVNEENAAGGRVVTAPTNGAAGILPAVGHYYLRFVPGADAAGIRTFLLTASAIASLVKKNASISGAEGGCQAEVGSACAMAAGALCAVLGGTPRQVENAAEIAMEHHLGLTCDPVGGLVQVPCIERNAIAASTAVSAARLALHGDGSHLVSLDAVIETMRQTGLDMMTKYKETSEGGLAVNVVEC